MDAYPTGPTAADLARIGRVLLNAAATMGALGHEGISGLLDYVDVTGMPWHERIVMDIIRCSQVGDSPEKAAAHNRLQSFLWDSGVMHSGGQFTASIDG